MKTFIGIDPGPTKSAYVMIEPGPVPKEIIVIHKGIVDNLKLLDVMPQLVVNDEWDGRSYNDVAIEMIASYGMPVGAETFETCLWIGRFIQVISDIALEPKLIYRKDVKLHLCHTVKAKDANIRQALIDRYGKPGTKKHPGITFGLSGDMWAALAVAVTYMEQDGGTQSCSGT